MKEHDINHYSTYSKLKASIVERLNRTLLRKLHKHFSLIASHKWNNILTNIITTYNNTTHRTIKMKPIEVNKMNEKRILSEIYKETIKLNNQKYMAAFMNMNYRKPYNQIYIS